MPTSAAASIRSAMTRAARSRTFDMSGVTTEDRDVAGLPGRYYRPKVQRAAAPLVYFHGGGFLFGDLDSHDRLCCRLSALMGVEIVSVAYRLVPGSPPPAQLDDALSACRALAAKGPIMVGGDSAGGYLAARAAMEMREAVAAQVLLYPLLQMHPELWRDRLFGASRWAGRMAIGWMAKMGLADAYPPLLDFDVTGLPPTVVATGDWFDPVSPDAAPFTQALDRAGVQVKQLVDLALVHGELCIPDRSRRAERVLAQVADAARDLGIIAAP